MIYHTKLVLNIFLVSQLVECNRYDNIPLLMRQLKHTLWNVVFCLAIEKQI
jgi:hypothetical protein